MNKTRRNLLLGAVATTSLGIFGLSLARQKVNAKTMPTVNAQLGINLAGIADWGTEFPFVDMFKQSRAWFVVGKDAANSGLVLDENGWVSQLPLGATASAIVSTLDNSHFPAGDYVILYDGEGVIKVPNQRYQLTEPRKSTKPGRMVVNVNGQNGVFRLDISNINPQNYIKNIRVVPIAQEETYLQNRWNPSFLARWSGVACLRFMDFMQTNGSQQAVWQNRPKPKDASFASKGVPLEWLVDLANQLNCDAWFCMPHSANDEYIKQFASYVKDNLKPNLQAWVEYSNEVWNSGFQQSKDASQAGLQLKLSSKSYEATFKYYAYRSIKIFKILTDVFNGHDRFVRVLATQAANQYASEQILSYQDVASHADVLAIAPYVPLTVSPKDENGINDKTVSSWSLNQLFEHLNAVSMPESTQWIKNSKKVADDYGLKLVAYEAGQHLVGVSGAENNEKLNDLLYRANSDARMGDIYSKSLSIWAQIGGDLTCSYNSVGSWSKWGSWGLLQYHDESIASAPKMMAVVKWVISRDQKMVLK